MIREKNLHRIFLISVIFKGIDGVLEIAGGILLFFTSAVSKVIMVLTLHEFSEDPNDFIASHLRAIFSPNTLHIQEFAALYLLIHGVIKIFLITGLLRHKLWAYPASIVFLILFILYQLYRFNYTHSTWLLALSIFDVLIVTLVWHEYTHVIKRIKHS